MPFEPTRELGGFIGTEFDPAPQLEDPSSGEVIGAALRSENTIGSFIASNARKFDGSDVDEDLDTFDEIRGTKYEPHFEQFVSVRNREHLEAVKMDVDRETEDRALLQKAGGAGIVAMIAAAAFDLPTLLPTGAAVRTAKTGHSILRVAGNTAIAGGIEATLSEAALQATQQTRGAEETAFNIGGSVILSGVLGAGAGALLRRAETKEAFADANQLSSRIEEDFTVPADGEIDMMTPGSLRAPLSADVTEVENTLKSALGLEKGLAFQDPMLRLQTNVSEKARIHVQELAETPLIYEKSARGEPTAPGGALEGAPGAVETRIKFWNAPLAEGVTAIDDSFVAYRKGRKKRIGDIAAIGFSDRIRGTTDLTYKEFKEEISKAMRNGDAHDILEVATAASTLRRKVFDPLKDEAIAQKLLPEGVEVETATSYLNRVYNKEKIIAERGGFKSRVVQWLRKERDKAEAGTRRADREDIELDDVAEQIIDRIIGTPDGRLPYDGHTPQGQSFQSRTARGPFKSRVFNIPDKMIEDYLENDIEHLLRVYTRTMASDVEIAKRFGSVDMVDQIKEIADEFNALMAKTPDGNEKIKLQKKKDAAIRDLAAIRDRLRGTFATSADPQGIMARAGMVVRSLNYLRLLGGMTVSAVPDMARPVMVHGFTRVFRDGLAPMFTNFNDFRLAANEVKMAGDALDMVLDTRAMQIADIMDDFGRGSKFERAIQSATQNFGVVSLMAPWNAAAKQFTGVVTMSRILQASQAIAKGRAGKSEIEMLASGGISEGLARKIAGEYSRFGTREGNVFLPNTANWSDRSAVEALRAAMVRDVDRIVVTPGQDKPIFMSTDLGRFVGQFKSFAIASTQRTMIAGLQQRDAAVLNGALLAIALGGVVHIAKGKLSGFKVDTDFSKEGKFEQFMVNAVDRSGLTGWLMEANNMTEKLTRGTVGLSALTGKQVSRYASRNIVGAMIGPTAGLIQDFSKVTGALFSGDFRQSDIRAVRRTIPYQNLFYIRAILDQAEEGINDAFGLPGR